MKALNDVKWNGFMISELFTIKPGKRLTKSDMTMGDRPYIGASDANNGITAFVSNTNNSLDCNVLGVNYNGSVVENFYHPYECVFSDDVKRLSFKHIKGNKYHYLFVKQIILMQKSKYQYGYKFNELRMRKQIILLPTTKSGIPDYAYMEEYMKEKERLILERYKIYLSQIIDNQDVKWGGGKFVK